MEYQHYLRLQASRYHNPSFKRAEYFFFTGSKEEGVFTKEALATLRRFHQFFEDLKQFCSDELLQAKLYVYLIPDELPSITMFIGTKKGEEQILLYIHEAPFTTQSVPKYVVQITEKSLLDIIKLSIDTAKATYPKKTLEEISSIIASQKQSS